MYNYFAIYICAIKKGRGRRGRVRMIVGFVTTYANSAYNR